MSDEILLFLVKKIPSCVDVFRLSETCTRMARDAGAVLDWSRNKKVAIFGEPCCCEGDVLALGTGGRGTGQQRE